MNEIKIIIIEQTSKTPRIELNHLTGEIDFFGKSIPENANKVYEPVYNWVAEYILNARSTTNVRLNLEYFNTSTSLWLVKILKLLVRIKEADYSLILHLYLEEEDYDAIEEFGDIMDAFAPITELLNDAIPSIGIKIYSTDKKGKIVKDKLVFV